MGESTHLLRGVVKGGVIVPETGTVLADGTAVEFRVVPAEFTPEERAEYEEWQKLGHRSWQMIDWWEEENAAG